MNFHAIPCVPSAVANSSDYSRVESSSAAGVYVDVLSDIIICGRDLRLVNLLKARRNVFVERSDATSK